MDIREIQDKSKVMSSSDWVGDIPNLPNVRLKVVPITAPSVIRYQSKLYRAVSFSDSDEEGDVYEDVEKKIDMDLMLNKVLEDWEGLTDKGEPVPYSKEMAEKMLEMDLFLGAVRFASARLSTMAEKRYEELVKNLYPSLSGSTTTTGKTKKQSKSTGGGKSGSRKDSTLQSS